MPDFNLPEIHEFYLKSVRVYMWGSDVRQPGVGQLQRVSVPLHELQLECRLSELSGWSAVPKQVRVGMS